MAQQQHANEQTQNPIEKQTKKKDSDFFTGDSDNFKALCEMSVGIKGPLQLMSLMNSSVALDNDVGMVWSKLYQVDNYTCIGTDVLVRLQCLVYDATHKEGRHPIST